jgi:hypothetical protein
MTPIEGVDFSTTAGPDSPSVGALNSSGTRFVGRYAVNDKAPSGRGITAAEYQRYASGGIDVFLYWEGAASWMLDGFAAGVAAAQNAQANLLAAGMPPTMPVFFACDVDATPEQQAPIDDCLRGCASVIGSARVGIYGGFYVVQRCSQNKTAQWFCQTLAWSGGQWFAGNHLEQYGFNDIIEGTDCDDVRALQANFGQASKFIGGSPVPTTPAPAPKPTPAPKPPVNYVEGMDSGVASRIFGSVKASNGITVAYSEGDELSDLWRNSGRFGRLLDVLVTNDQPTRIYWIFSHTTYWRPNPNAPIREMKP